MKTLREKLVLHFNISAIWVIHAVSVHTVLIKVIKVIKSIIISITLITIREVIEVIKVIKNIIISIFFTAQVF